MKVTELNTYPIKSTRGIAHQTVSFDLKGPCGDRRWMIVDHENYFVTQRELARLATIEVAETADGLSLTLGDVALEVRVPDGEDRANVMVWGDTVFAACASEDVNAALSDYLDKSVRLVHMDERAKREAGPEFAGNDKPLSFADGFPILLTSEVSLAALNAKIIDANHTAVPMTRFRPSIVIDGVDAWAEDGWATLKIGDMIFDAVKPCTRCVVTTRDQKTGLDDGTNQPVRALTQTRRSGDRRVRGVLFGWNLLAREPGTLSVGDHCEVLEMRQTPWPLG